MAKKSSAKSKGYRKTVQKKPYLTKKEIIITACIAAALILALVLFNAFYDDGSLKVRKGQVQVSENSLVLNAGSSKYPAYYKVGQLADIDGYSLTSRTNSTDANVREYIYYPEGESAIDLISINTYSYDASVFTSVANQTYAGDSTKSVSELKTIDDDGHAVSYLTVSVLEAEEATQTSEEISEESIAAVTEYGQSLHAYVNVNTDQTIYILVRNEAESPEEYVEISVLEDALHQVLSVLSYETK